MALLKFVTNNINNYISNLEQEINVSLSDVKKKLLIFILQQCNSKDIILDPFNASMLFFIMVALAYYAQKNYVVFKPRLYPRELTVLLECISVKISWLLCNSVRLLY